MTRFSEIWVDTIRQVYAEVPETEIIRFTTPAGTGIWATFMVLDVLMPGNTPRDLTVYGTTENGEPVEHTFLEDADDYPPEIAPLIPALITASETCPAPRPAAPLTPPG